MKPTDFDALLRSLPSEAEKLEALATAARVPFHTLLKIAKGVTKNPRIRTVEAIAKAMQKERAA